ncbi:hypothetical protein HZH66_012371 [Vespula vulgaris]|nr:hypothetical protein HZH66_012371 [Vespula vulgaris]
MTQIPGMGDVTGPNDGEQVGVGLALLGLPSAQYYATLGICYYRDCFCGGKRAITVGEAKIAQRWQRMERGATVGQNEVFSATKR